MTEFDNLATRELSVWAVGICISMWRGWGGVTWGGVSLRNINKVLWEAGFRDSPL